MTWTYDRTNQLRSERRSGANAYQHTFTYDPAGNRQRLAEAALLTTLLTTYTYDMTDRLQRLVTITGRTTYTFDACGNQRSVAMLLGLGLGLGLHSRTTVRIG